MILFKENILIIDLSNMFFFCNPPWISEKIINGTYDMVDQFMVMLNSYIRITQPSKIYFAIDGWPEWRREIHPEYKNNRSKERTPAWENFHRNKKAIKELLKYFPFGLIGHPQLEADDCAYIICKYYENKDVNITVLSTDKDWLQLINHFKNVKVYNQLKKLFIDKLEQDIVKIKCLTGDTSDNISGFKKIGEKRAKKILENENEWLSNLSDEDKKLYERNMNLISFKRIPEKYIEETLKIIETIEFKKNVDWYGAENYYDTLNLDKNNLNKYKQKIEEFCRI